MRDTHDQRMRELANRLIEMAPEAPPFPEEPMVKLKNDTATTRSGSRRTLAVAASLAVALVIGIAATTLLLDDDSAPPLVTQAVDFPNSTTTFVSPTNGFSLKYPDKGPDTITPATTSWRPGDGLGAGFDVVEIGLGSVFSGGSMRMWDVGSVDEYYDEIIRGVVQQRGGCSLPRSQQAEITIDGQPGRILECPNEIEATVVAGEQLYLFTLSHTRSDARAVFDAFAATIDLTPDTAVYSVIDIYFDPLLLTTHVSPTNGYSFEGHSIRGPLTPAEQLWDPVSGARDNDPHWGYFGPGNGFDVVETALGAVFMGASTEIPDGVSIDEWVDDVIEDLPGCFVRVIPQAEITIDGQPGRISECLEEIDATVVAGGRLYFFRLRYGGPPAEGRAWFDAFIATIDLRPEDAALPSNTP